MQPVHRFLAPGATGGTIDLDTTETHHLVHVLRVRAGAEVIVFDGRGHEWLGRVASASKDHASVDLIARRPALPEPPVAVTLAIGLLKGDQMDSVVRDATMLGVAAIVPVTTAHVAVPAAGIKARSVDRWKRVAIASAKQCARAVVPDIQPVTPLAAVLGSVRADLTVMCVEPSGSNGARVADLARPASALVCIGPEGGWAKEEIELARGRDAALIALGPRTLRAETAPTVALTALWTHWDWV